MGLPGVAAVAGCSHRTVRGAPATASTKIGSYQKQTWLVKGRMDRTGCASGRKGASKAMWMCYNHMLIS